MKQETRGGWNMRFLLFTIFAAMTIITIQSAFADTHDNLVAYITFDNENLSGNTILDTIGTYHGQIFVTDYDAVVNQTGLFGEAFHFNNTISIPYHVILDNVDDELYNQDATFSMYVKFNQFFAGTQNGFFGNLNNIAEGAGLYAGTGNVAAFFGGTGYEGTTPLTENEWHHVVLVVNSTQEIKVYVDGVLEIDQATSWSSSRVNVQIGCHFASFYQEECGDVYIDDFAMYDVALDEARVTELFNNPLGNETSCTPDWTCVGYAACLPNSTKICNLVTDLELCSEPYTGDYSEFPAQACIYNVTTGYEPQYGTGDYVAIMGDGIGTAGAVFVNFIALIVIVGLAVWGYSKIKKAK